MAKQTEKKRVFIIAPNEQEIDLLAQFCEILGFEAMAHSGLEGATIAVTQLQPHIVVIRIKLEILANEYLSFGHWCRTSDVGSIFLIGVVNLVEDHHHSKPNGMEITLESVFDHVIHIPFSLDEFRHVLLNYEKEDFIRRR